VLLLPRVQPIPLPELRPERILVARRPAGGGREGGMDGRRLRGLKNGRLRVHAKV